ncbi:MAG: DUF3147 family protein [Gammaproteobacteria bacterium]
MTHYIIKIALTTFLIVAISEIAKRSSFIAALLASIHLVSLLAILWLYFDTKDVTKVSDLASSIFWLVLPSLVLFITLPLLLKLGWSFYQSFFASILLTIISYWILISLLQYSKIKL